MENPAELTNRVLFLRLINAIIDLGFSGKTRIITDISTQYLPERALALAQEVEKRMRPEMEVIPGVRGKPVVPAPQTFDPEKDLPGGVIPMPEELTSHNGLKLVHAMSQSDPGPGG